MAIINTGAVERTIIGKHDANFVHPLGDELVLNGQFDTDSDWTLVGDVSISNGVCTFFDTGSNTNSRLIQSTITANKTYKLVFRANF